MPSFESILEPSDSREPFYDGADLDRSYSWTCQSCDQRVDVNLGSIQKAAWSWPNELSESLVADLQSHFRIGPERAHGGGWVSLLVSACQSCSAKYVLYTGVDEYANSAYRIHIQGLARVVV